jgi:hypothetical protein
MPAAANEVRARTEKDTIKAVIHCQGSCAFMMAITAGLLPDVSVVVSNSSALHPIMPRIARIKLPRPSTSCRLGYKMSIRSGAFTRQLLAEGVEHGCSRHAP